MKSVSHGKPCAGNPHARFEEGASASKEPRRNALLHTTTLRIDDNLKQDCDAIFEDLGLSLSGAVTLFLRQVVKQRAIPFAISCDKAQSFGYYPPNVMTIRERAERAKRFAAELRESSTREWTLDEINAEISASRSGR